MLLPSIAKAPILEQNSLPSHLKHNYLKEKNTFSINMLDTYLIKMTKKLLRVLWDHKSSISWTVVNIKGISPSVCIHMILFEHKTKPIRRAKH